MAKEHEHSFDATNMTLIPDTSDLYEVTFICTLCGAERKEIQYMPGGGE